MRQQLPPELALFGDHLQAAAERALARRRARRTAFLNGIATIAVAVPLALAVLTSDLSPSGAQQASIGAAAAQPALGWTPGFDLAVSHIRDANLVLRQPVLVCLDANDCRTPVPFTLEAPLGKV